MAEERERRPRRNFDEDRVDDGFEERIIRINRVAKVVKGGKNFSFAVIAAVGDKKGRVGIGTGKANEVPDAMKKAVAKARKNLYKIPLVKGTIPHEILGIYGAGKVLLKPAGPGTGVIAGGGVRPILELAGVENILTKSIGSSNAINVVRATMTALQLLKDKDEVKRLRHADERPERAEEKPARAAEQTDKAEKA